MICKCYHAEKNFLGKIGVCWGTAECDACLCGGDKSKCDFYPSAREEGKKLKTNYDLLVSKSPEELAKHLCCPWSICKNMDVECNKCLLDWLKQEAKE